MTATPILQSSQIETTSANITATVSVTEDLLYFPGHFPGQSILPGFAMIDWVMVLSQTEFDLPLSGFEPLRLEVIKFKNVVQPGMEITLHIEKKNNRLYYQVISDQGEHCSGRICINLSE